MPDHRTAPNPGSPDVQLSQQNLCAPHIFCPASDTDEGQNERADFQLIRNWVSAKSHVLDVGCDDGSLLASLRDSNQVKPYGIELSQDGVHKSIQRGLSVIQGNADTDLDAYPDKAFDYAILSHTLQATGNPCRVIDNLVRIGKYAIVSFPNFGHFKVRWHLLTRGQMPKNSNLPYEWWDTPNIHFCTIQDFLCLCQDMDIQIVDSAILTANGATRTFKSARWANIFGEYGVFLIKRD